MKYITLALTITELINGNTLELPCNNSLNVGDYYVDKTNNNAYKITGKVIMLNNDGGEMKETICLLYETINI